MTSGGPDACQTAVMLVTRDNARFVEGSTPLLMIAGAPVHDALPKLERGSAAMPVLEGWSLHPSLTMCVVDGPGGRGCLVAGAFEPDTMDEMTTWIESAHRAGGAVVVSVASIPGDDLSDLTTDAPHSHGGFVRLG